MINLSIKAKPGPAALDTGNCCRFSVSKLSLELMKMMMATVTVMMTVDFILINILYAMDKAEAELHFPKFEKTLIN